MFKVIFMTAALLISLERATALHSAIGRVPFLSVVTYTSKSHEYEKAVGSVAAPIIMTFFDVVTCESVRL